MEVNEVNNTINVINITGDFFAYPEESINELEMLLQQTRLNKKDLFEIISSFIENNQVQFIGIDAASITEAIMRCEQ